MAYFNFTGSLDYTYKSEVSMGELNAVGVLVDNRYIVVYTEYTEVHNLALSSVITLKSDMETFPIREHTILSDGRLAYCCFNTNTIRIRNLVDSDTVKLPSDKPLRLIELDPGFIAVKSEGKITVWNLTEHSICGTIKDTSRPNPFIYLSDNRFATCASDSGDIYIHTLGKKYTLRGHRDRVYDMSYNRHNKYLVTSSWDRTIRVWNLTTAQTHVLHGYMGSVLLLCSGDVIFTDRNTLYIWRCGYSNRSRNDVESVSQVGYLHSLTLVEVNGCEKLVGTTLEGTTHVWI